MGTTGQNRFGDLALRMGAMTREQVDECLAIQKKEYHARPVGKIAISKGYLQRSDVKIILELQRGSKETPSGEHLAITRDEPERTPTPVPEKSTGGPTRSKPPSWLDGELSEYLGKEQAATRAADKTPAKPAPEPSTPEPPSGESASGSLFDVPVAAPAAEEPAEPGEAPFAPEILESNLELVDVYKLSEDADDEDDATIMGAVAANQDVPVIPLAADVDAPAPEAEEVTRPIPLDPALGAGPTQIVESLSLARQKGASDLHLHSGAPIILRLDGELVPLERTPDLEPRAVEEAVAGVLTEAQRERLERVGDVDFAYAVEGLGRFRVNCYRQRRGLDIVFRLVPPQPPTLGDLHLPESLYRMCDYRTGLILCTGPAGCGKSTTMVALLQRLIETRQEHVITIEDPIECLFARGRALVNQRQVGPHTTSFARALRAALREDPDIISIAEMRDPETISLAITAAETGHLVLGTLHTEGAAQTINRIINAFPPKQQAQIRVMLSESLRAVISQKLARRADGKGRVPVLEILIVNPAVANAIRDDKVFQIHSMMQIGRSHGMQLLEVSLAELTKAGIIDKAEARRLSGRQDRADT